VGPREYSRQRAQQQSAERTGGAIRLTNTEHAVLPRLAIFLVSIVAQVWHNPNTH
jgi:hypothetical protein